MQGGRGTLYHSSNGKSHCIINIDPHSLLFTSSLIAQVPQEVLSTDQLLSECTQRLLDMHWILYYFCCTSWVGMAISTPDLWSDEDTFFTITVYCIVRMVAGSDSGCAVCQDYQHDNVLEEWIGISCNHTLLPTRLSTVCCWTRTHLYFSYHPKIHVNLVENTACTLPSILASLMC